MKSDVIKRQCDWGTIWRLLLLLLPKALFLLLPIALAPQEYDLQTLLAACGVPARHCAVAAAALELGTTTTPTTVDISPASQEGMAWHVVL